MPGRVILYEDHGWQRLLPLVYIRACFQLVCGLGSLLEQVQRICDADQSARPENGPQVVQSLWCRPNLAELVAEQTGIMTNAPLEAPALLINGRGFWHQLPKLDAGENTWLGVVDASRMTACIAVANDLREVLTPEVLLDEARFRAAVANCPRRDVSDCVTLFRWPWELVLYNALAIREQWRSGMAGIESSPDRGSYLLQPESIHVGAGTRIKPTVVIDAEQGPVWIGKNVTIQPHSFVEGPAVIGDSTLLQPGATVHAGTTIGTRCKVGGEIEGSIIHGYSNKQHDGFLGHSYVAEWVNIAADCINSDLKNTYGTVRVPINGREIDSGEMFVGMLVGDYSKAGINVSFPTGAVMGFCSSVFAATSPKFVPSFAWINGDTTERFDEQRGLAIARKVMARRQKTLSPGAESVFRSIRRQALAFEHQPQLKLEQGPPSAGARDPG